VHLKKDLFFTGLRRKLYRVFCGIADGRDPEKTRHVIHDVMMSGFAMEPSLVQFLGNHYVLVAKPADHKKLMEWVNEMRLLKEVIHMEFNIYEWINDVPLNDNKKTLVNYFEYKRRRQDDLPHQLGDLFCDR
jgi:hypothetical protein